MRVLHVPFNIASQMGYNIRGLRLLGVDAVGLAPFSIVADNTGIAPLREMKRSNLMAWLFARCVNSVYVLYEISRADIVHWYFSPAIPFGVDVYWAKLLGKKCLVEFCGSEIRNSEIECADNPYYAESLGIGYEYASIETASRSRYIQSLFSSARAVVCTPSPSLDLYLVPGFFDKVYRLRSRIWVDEFSPVYSNKVEGKLLVIHSPTAPIGKGTRYVEAAVRHEMVKDRVDYKRIQGIPHAEAKDLVRKCDIFLDQFITGDYGVAAIEAMAYGKPVVCYIKPSVKEKLPNDLPIVVATGEELPDVILNLVNNPELRLDLGRRGRAFVEKYHDAKHLAHDLKAIYQSMLEGR